MTIEKQTLALTMAGIMPRLVRRYLELSEACYRVSVSQHDERGRFRKGHVGRRPHPALVQKVDLDQTLEQVYERFFGYPGATTSTSTSNSRRQGRDARTSGGGGPAPAPSKAE